MLNKKLFILIWDMGPGGIQKRVRDIVLEIDTNYSNWDVYFFIKFETPHYFLDALKDCKRVHITFLRKNRRIKRHFPSTLWIMKEFIRVKPDVCLTFLEQLSISMILTKLLLSRIKKTKVVLNEGVFTSKYLDLNRNFFWKAVMKSAIHFFYRFADQIIVPTKQVKTGLTNSFKLSGEMITIIPNWTLFQPIKEAPINKTFDFIYLTRFEKEKNPLLFIQIVKKLRKDYPHVKAILFGEGRLQQQIESELQKDNLHKNIKLMPFTKNPQRFLLLSKILLFTSQNEGMPNTILEAAMCQVPTITTNFAGAEEIILHAKTGYIADSDEQMFNFARQLFSDKKKVAELGLNAQKHVVKNFYKSTQKKFIETLLE